MRPDPIRLTREQLYQAVWETPARKLARSYGISDVALAKICRKHNIPKPGLGHWRLVELGRRSSKTPLPPNGCDVPQVISIYPRPQPDTKLLTPEITQAVNEVCGSERAIQVRVDFRGAHQLVREARDKLKRSGADSDNRLRPRWNESCLRVLVTKENLDRALLIMDALIAKFESMGHRVDAEKRDTRILISGSRVSVILMERVRRSERELTPEERKGGYAPNRWVFTPTGELIFRIEYGPDGIRKNWQDGKSGRLESFLPDIIQSILVTAEYYRRCEIERQERERQWEIERKRREELDRLEQQEVARRKHLEQQAELWDRCQRIRAFVEAATPHVRDIDSAQKPLQGLRWMKWALDHSARLDPLKNGDLQRTVQSFPNNVVSLD